MTSRPLAGLAFVGSLALLAAGCGGGSGSPGVASIGATTTPATTATTTTTPAGGGATSSTGGTVGNGIALAGRGGEIAKFSSCMRTHGVPNFPDPDSQGTVSINASSGINPGSPSFQHAQQQCREYLPNAGQPPSPAQQAQMQAQALKYSECMRSHGVAGFPDPDFHGGTVQIKISASSGIDPRSPQFQAAQAACQKDLPGPKGGPGGGAGKQVSGNAAVGP
jgi:hypothetical protein